jgi:MHS family proline/betaine transporter-like MFS transporter
VLWLVGLTGNPTVVVFYCIGALVITLIGAVIVRETAGEPLRER